MDGRGIPTKLAGGSDSSIRPSLPELVALRGSVTGRRSAKFGRHGVTGHALSPLRGRGMEYAESRDYVAGDDALHIDWRLSEMTGRGLK